MSWSGLQGDAVSFAESPLESARFGVGVARLTIGWDIRPDGQGSVRSAAADVTQILQRAHEDVVVVRYPAAALELAAAIARSGREVLPAGTLTYWSVRVDDVRPHVDVPGLDVLALSAFESSAERTALVEDLVADAFSGYGNHYAADPLLRPEAALEGYQEWATRTVTDRPHDALVLRLEGRPIGLATLLQNEVPVPHVEVLLAGLRPSAQGRGLYGRLLSAAVGVARERGTNFLVISTQAHNVRVQRAWSRLGLRPIAAFETVHAIRAGRLDEGRSWVASQDALPG